MIPEIPADSFAKRLYSTYLSYLPKEKAIFDLKMNIDQRGSFTELVHTLNCGQVSLNISRPGITKGATLAQYQMGTIYAYVERSWAHSTPQGRYRRRC